MPRQAKSQQYLQPPQQHQGFPNPYYNGHQYQHPPQPHNQQYNQQYQQQYQQPGNSGYPTTGMTAEGMWAQQHQASAYAQQSLGMVPVSAGKQLTTEAFYLYLREAMAQQYLMTAPVVVPAPVLMEVVAQVQYGNDLLRKESQARNVGMGRVVDAVNSNLRRMEVRACI